MSDDETPAIDPSRHYTLAEAARHVPSAFVGRKKISVSTLHAYRKQGRLKCRAVQTTGSRVYYLVMGADLIEFIETEYLGTPQQKRQSKLARARARARAREVEVNEEDGRLSKES